MEKRRQVEDTVMDFEVAIRAEHNEVCEVGKPSPLIVLVPLFASGVDVVDVKASDAAVISASNTTIVETRKNVGPTESAIVSLTKFGRRGSLLAATTPGVLQKVLGVVLPILAKPLFAALSIMRGATGFATQCSRALNDKRLLARSARFGCVHHHSMIRAAAVRTWKTFGAISA